MPLQNSLDNRISDTFDLQIHNVIEELVNQIEITSDFCLNYPNYNSWEFSSEIKNRLEKLAAELQNRYLSLRLASFIYQIFSNCASKNTVSNEELPRESILENNTWWGLNVDFCQQLHQGNSGEGYFDPDWQVIKHKDDNHLIVRKDDLNLTIKPEQHLASGTSVKAGDIVAVRLPRNLVEEGYYIAVGNAGLNNFNNLIEIYFNVDSQGAIALMKALTLKLNKIRSPFTFKVLYDPDRYYRYDSSVLRLNKSDYCQVEKIIQTIYQQNRSNFQSQVLPFTKLLAPGLSVAEEPDSKFAFEESFGMNRCRLIAHSLLEAWQTGNNSPEKRKQLLRQNFADQGLNWQHPYLNPGSEDIYQSTIDN